MTGAVTFPNDLSLYSNSHKNTLESTDDSKIESEMVGVLNVVQGDDLHTFWGKQGNEDVETKVKREPHIKTPLIRLPPGSLPSANVEVIQQWEGVVTSVSDSSFFADLQDLKDSTFPLEVVELPVNEVPVDDRPLLSEGAVFYWSIGYEYGDGGQVRRISEIRMKRVPSWTKRSLRKVMEQGVELFEIFGR